jgi:DNA adenine methylase
VKAREITTVAPWFGSNRMLAQEVGKELEGCKWVGVPFAGGMCELLYIKASHIVVSDVHRHVINLARVMADPAKGPKLYRRLRRKTFHVDEHRDCQSRAKERQPQGECDIDAAEDYFAAVWMGRSSLAGIDDEFCGRLPVRWNANGGDSNKRYRSATSSIMAWRRVFPRCNFLTLDVFEFLDKVDDDERHGLYLDPPFPGPGDRYKFQFTEQQHRDLTKRLTAFKRAKVVCRFYDHPLVRELYSETHWRWRRLEGRDQANNGKKPEVLLINDAGQATLF